MVALGNQFTGVYSNSDELYHDLETAALAENDRVWRMPLDEGYMSQISGYVFLSLALPLSFFFFLFSFSSPNLSIFHFQFRNGLDQYWR